MEGTLKPNYHYIEVMDDFSDLEERLNYYIEHPDEAEAIIQHAHEYVARFQDKEREKLISLLVLKKYFEATNGHYLDYDLITEQNKTYSIADPLLRIWLRSNLV